MLKQKQLIVFTLLITPLVIYGDKEPDRDPVYTSESIIRGATPRNVIEAIQRGNLRRAAEILPEAVDAGLNVHTANENGETLLHIIASVQDVQTSHAKNLIQMLKDYTLDINEQANEGKTPLFYAVAYQNIPVVKALLECGANPNIADTNQTVPLHAAVRYNDINMASLLYAHGANIHAQAENGLTPLHMAAADGNIAMVFFLIARNASVNRASAEIENTRGLTPLHIAARGGHADIAKILLQHNADANAQTENNMLTPLHYMIIHNDAPDVARVLLQYGTDPNAEASNNRRPLHLITSSTISTASILFGYKAHIHVQSANGKTPLHIAVANNNAVYTYLLATLGADFNIQDQEGKTAWQYAREKSNQGIFRIFSSILQRLNAVQESPHDGINMSGTDIKKHGLYALGQNYMQAAHKIMRHMPISDKATMIIHAYNLVMRNVSHADNIRTFIETSFTEHGHENMCGKICDVMHRKINNNKMTSPLLAHIIENISTQVRQYRDAAGNTLLHAIAQKPHFNHSLLIPVLSPRILLHQRNNDNKTPLDIAWDINNYEFLRVAASFTSRG